MPISLRTLGGVLVVALAMTSIVSAVEPTKEELAQSHAWAQVRFAGRPASPAAAPGLIVLANHDPLQLNARGGRPMNIAGANYQRGLYCHANSRVVVRLPGPGKLFKAIIGVDSNDQTSGGRGSVVFAVSREGKELFASPVLHEGTAGVPVSVDLGGARELTLTVGDAGDGISCDQSDWADAQVELADGRVIWLGDLPVIESENWSDGFPYSFQFGGKSSTELLADWPCQRSLERLDERRTRHTVTHTDPQSRLAVRCVAVEYHDFPVVEWTIFFKNEGKKETAILENIQALDVAWQRGTTSQPALHHFVGSLAEARDFAPLLTTLTSGTSTRLTAAGGRPSNGTWPYFNVQWSGKGLILAVGWPGQWAAAFERDQQQGLRLRAGQELTHCKLLPGEQVRTPLMAMQFYDGDWIRAQNIWRRWMLAHNLPRPGGQLPPVQMAACSSHQFGEMIHANSDSQKQFIDRYLEEKLPLDYWWMDAGWYLCDGQWPKTGTWEVDQQRFPGGLRPICDHAHAKQVKIIVWFEPERVAEGTWLAENRREWILGGSGGNGLLNLGNEAARQWLTEHVDKLLVSQGVDLYRQDFNIDPLNFWRGNDSPDRQGITENHHVSGYLAYWDELIRRHPNMLIDSCASGGRRNDLETMRRAVPLLRSDYIMEPIGNQGHTYGLSFWLPYQGTGTGSRENTPYLLRSVMLTSFTACFDVRRTDLNYEMIRRTIDQWRQYGRYYFADYYPLTPYSLERSDWIAWQFNLPESGEGMVQAFRREESSFERARFKLHDLDPGATYEINDLDAPNPQSLSGKELMESGIAVTMTEQPGSAVIVYRKIP